MTISFAPNRIAKLLTWVAVSIATMGVAAEFVRQATDSWPHHGVAELAAKFVLDGELSLPSWFSSIALLGCAVVLGLIACAQRQSRSAFATHWTGLALFFMLLSLDELAAFHEVLIPPLRRIFGASGIFYYAWVIPALVFVAGMGLAYARFLFVHLDSPTRRRFVIAAALCVGGAVGMELVEGPVDLRFGQDSLPGQAAITIEETLEMLGVIYFLYTLLTYVAEHVGAVRLEFADARARTPAVMRRHRRRSIPGQLVGGMGSVRSAATVGLLSLLTALHGFISPLTRRRTK